MVAKSYSSQGKPSQKSRQGNYSATIVFADNAEIIYKALMPEGKNVKRLRSSYVLKMKNHKLKISINASDMTAFKATINTIIKGSELASRINNG